MLTIVIWTSVVPFYTLSLCKFRCMSEISIPPTPRPVLLFFISLSRSPHTSSWRDEEELSPNRNHSNIENESIINISPWCFMSMTKHTTGTAAMFTFWQWHRNRVCARFTKCLLFHVYLFFFVSLHTLNFLNGQIVECPVHRVSVDHIRLTLACVQLLKMFTIKLILIRVPLWTQEMFHSPFGASRHMNNEMRVPSFVYASVCMCVCVYSSSYSILSSNNLGQWLSQVKKSN